MQLKLLSRRSFELWISNKQGGGGSIYFFILASRDRCCEFRCRKLSAELPSRLSCTFKAKPVVTLAIRIQMHATPVHASTTTMPLCTLRERSRSGKRVSARTSPPKSDARRPSIRRCHCAQATCMDAGSAQRDEIAIPILIREM